MNILDENIDLIRRQQLLRWKIHVRQIGIELGYAGMKDRNEIIPLLHTLRRPTLLTRDDDFYHPQLRHPGYCLAYFDVTLAEAARYIRRFLRHPAFRTQAQRMGKVARVHQSGITFWQVGADESSKLDW
ncbi:MAG: hypothetical protein ACREEM_11175 [Blastocatellia bacterium]